MNGSWIIETEIPDAIILDEIIDDGLVCKGLTWPVIKALVRRKKAVFRFITVRRIHGRELIKSARVICYDVIGEVCILFIYTVIYTTMNILYCDFMCVPRNEIRKAMKDKVFGGIRDRARSSWREGQYIQNVMYLWLLQDALQACTDNYDPQSRLSERATQQNRAPSRKLHNTSAIPDDKSLDKSLIKMKRSIFKYSDTLPTLRFD